MKIHKWGASDQQILEMIPKGAKAQTLELTTPGGMDKENGILTLAMSCSLQPYRFYCLRPFLLKMSYCSKLCHSIAYFLLELSNCVVRLYTCAS